MVALMLLATLAPGSVQTLLDHSRRRRLSAGALVPPVHSVQPVTCWPGVIYLQFIK